MRFIWAIMALLSAGAVVAAAFDEPGRERLVALLDTSVSVDVAFDAPAEVGRLAVEIERMRSETRLLALEKEALNIKISALESEYGPITGSLPETANVEAIGAEGADVAMVDGGAGSDPLMQDPSAKPKSVRTIDIGFSPLPLDANTEETGGEGQNSEISESVAGGITPPVEDVQEQLAELADPYARRLPTEIMRTRFAIQIGIEDTMDAVRERWKTLSREQDILIGALEPVVAIAEAEDKIRIRLLAGPFNNAADAIQVCTLLNERGVECSPVRSEGQKLVMR